MGLRSRWLPGCAWLVFNLLAVSAMAQAARNELEEKFRVKSFDDDVEISVKRTVSGPYADRERKAIASVVPASLQRQYLLPYQRRYGQRTQIVGDLDVKDDTANNIVTVTLKLNAPDGLRDNEANWGLGYAAANIINLLPRNTAVDSAFRYAMEMEFPADLAVFSNPATKKIRDAGLDFTMDSSFFGNRAVAVVEVNTTPRPAAANPADGIAQFESAARQVYEAVRGMMYVNKDTVRQRKLLRTDKPSLRQVVEHNSALTVDRTSKVLEQRPRGEPLMWAHCERAQALVSLGKPDAMRDADAAVEANPTMAIAHHCRGTVRTNLGGDTTASIADFSKAIELDPLARSSYLARGIALLYSGQTANAAEDFARSQRAGEAKNEVSISTAMWRTIALKRLGRPIDPALAQLAAEQPRGAWPRPTLAVVNGVITVDEMMEIVNRRSGLERDMQTIEAWFAAGQWYLMQGDKVKAAEAFRKVREVGTPGFLEYRGAGAELVGLEGVK